MNTPGLIEAGFPMFVFQSDIHLIKKGEKVGASEAALLGMLKIYPFSYGLVCKTGKLVDHAKSGLELDTFCQNLTDYLRIYKS